MEKISWIQKVTNEEVLRRVQEERQLLGNIRERKHNWLEHIIRRKENITNDALEGMVEGKRGRGRSRIQLLNEIKIENY